MARKLGWALAPGAFLMIAAPAWAHTPGLAGGDFAAGILHPLTGVDHLLAMVAVGVWAALQGGRRRWLLPLAFMAAMAAGGAAGLAGLPLVAVEPAIAASVLVLGLMIALSKRLPAWAAMALVAVFACFHGHAHGLEGAGAVSWPAYALGFVAATGVLHGVGIFLGLLLERGGGWMPRLAGGAISIAGVILLGGVLAG